MSSTVGFNLAIYQGVPLIWGSVQNLDGLTAVYQAVPFIANSPPGVNYVNDSLGRLNKLSYSNQTEHIFNYDPAGNRTSVVTNCPSGTC